MNNEKVTRLYRQYGPVIYSCCRRLLCDKSAAADATQETFMRVMRHLDKAPPEAIAWIYRIATNYCLNEIRDRRGMIELPPDLPDDLDEGGLERALADRDQAERLMRAVPEKLRAVAWLTYVDDLDQAEVAETLGISRRTVVNRLGEFKERAAKLARRTS
jgi:RNA polymerase sigma-70 factor (ECF subfamily)